MSLISPYLLLILLKGLNCSTKTPRLKKLRTRPHCKLSCERRGLKVKERNEHPVQVATKYTWPNNFSSETVQDSEKTKTKMKKTTYARGCSHQEFICTTGL